MCRCGNSTLWKCGDVVDPHCQDVEMWWIHIFSVAVHINFEFYPRINVNFHYADPQYICIYSHLKCGNPHCSTLHPPSKCGDVVDPHCIHILRVKDHIASTSQATWALSSTSYH